MRKGVGTWRIRAAFVAATILSNAALQEAHSGILDKVLGRYPSKDSGMLARSQSEHDLHWLDDERIAFIGSKPGETRVENGRPFPKSDLFVWNISTGDIRRMAELSNRSRLCVAPGYVRYDFERNGILYARFGEFYSTHEVEADVQAMKDGILAVSPLSCREYNPKLLKKRYGNWALPLLRPGEYLDRTSRDYKESMRYFPEDGSDPIPLPKIPNRDVISTPRYSEFLKKYVFNEIRRRGGPEFTQRAWLLDTQGQVTEVVMPAGPWMAALAVTVLPAQGGWILTSRARGKGPGFGAAGIYLVQDLRVVQLISGFPHAFAISPDGCKVATSIEVKPRQETARPTVWLIDLCLSSRPEISACPSEGSDSSGV